MSKLKKKSFKCDCSGCSISVTFCDIDTEYPFLSIEIYSLYNKTGNKKLKRPRPLGDVILLDRPKSKVYTDFLDFIKNHSAGG